MVLKTLNALLFEDKTPPPYADWTCSGDDVNVTYYQTGKLCVQGKGTALFLEHVLAPLLPHVPMAEYGGGACPAHSTALPTFEPASFVPHAGLDESGKGDFFGPLVTAAVYADVALAQKLCDVGVKDCKMMSDKNVLELAPKLKQILGMTHFAILILKNETYNRLYRSMGNLNTLMAWAHATTLENLLSRNTHCTRALLDQFANPKVIQRHLKTRGKNIVLEQRTKAESQSVAVAAASILARAAFLETLHKLSQTYQRPFPKGCSLSVTNMVKTLARENLPFDFYNQVCKMHFKTFTDHIVLEDES